MVTSVTGSFSGIPVYGANPESINVEVWFVTSQGECSQRNEEALDNYVRITHQILSKYNIYPNADSSACIPDKYLTEFLAERSPDLLVIIPDMLNSVKWLVTKDILGHNYYNGRNNVIVSGAISPYVESASATWVLSHELAHFALSYKGYPYEVYGDGVHILQDAYDRCKSEDATGAFCPQLWSTVTTYSGKTFPVMAPLYTKDYVSETSRSPSTSNPTSTQQATSKLGTLINLYSPTRLVDGGYQTFDAGNQVLFSGQLFSKRSDNVVELIAGATIRIVDKNEYKTTEKNYIPLIGYGVTNNEGKFSISWNAIKHTGFVHGDSSMWTPVAHFDGDSKYIPTERQGSQFWVKDLPKVQPIIDSDNDGILDNIDSCRYNAENFNSYQDIDGCPDTKPQQATSNEFSTTKSESLIDIKNGFQNEAIEGDRITIMGTLREVFSRTSETNYGSYSMPNEKIVVRSSNGKIIGSDYTDEHGDFQITINFDFDESVHTIMTQGDGRKYFKMPIIFEYEGNSKVNLDTEDRSRDVYLRGENYKAEEHPKKSYSNDGDLSVDRNEFVRSQHSSITINGNAYWIADRGEIVNLYVINPDNVKQEHKVRLTSEKTFSLSIPLNSNSPLGWYEVGGYYIQKNDSYQPEQYFNPISFKVVNQITITDYVSKNDPVESSKVTPIETPNVTPPQQVDKPIIVQPVKEPELKTSAEDSQRDDATRLHEHYQQARVDLQKGIKTAENSLSGLKYSSPEAQKKIEDAWSVRWMALTDLKTINDKMYSAEIELQEHHYVKAIKLLQEIDSYPKKISDDLTWISKSITDAEKLEKDHKSQDFLAFAFNSGEGKTCIWFICW